MRKILAVALLCGLGFIPATTEAKSKSSPRSHTGSSFVHVVHGRSYRFESHRVHGRDCFRFWWEARRCYVYWYPGATCYYVLNDTGLVPVTAVLPATGPTVPVTGPVAPVDAGLPPLPTGTAPAPVDDAAPMTETPR